MSDQAGGEQDRKGPTCNVNSTFNFSVGGIVFALTAALAYVAYRSLG